MKRSVLIGSAGAWAIGGLLVGSCLAALPAHGGPVAAEVSDLAAEADLGGAIAQERLGLAYLRGDNAPPDRAKALFWLNRSANQGNVSAQLALSRQLMDLNSGSAELVIAYKWALIAAKSAQDDKVQYQATDILDNLARRMAPSQIADARTQAAGWSATAEFKLPPDTTIQTGGSDGGQVDSAKHSKPASSPTVDSVRHESPRHRGNHSGNQTDRKLRQLEYQLRVGAGIVARALGM